MRWEQVEIIDNNDNLLNGDAAKRFVERYCPPGIVQSYLQKDYTTLTVKLKRGGKPSVQPSIVKRVLWDNLKSLVKEVRVYERVLIPEVKAVVPRKAKTNPINIKPRYEITLELGDINALFNKITLMNEPWKDTGVQQRLQVLGYLYTPLNHPGNQGPNFHHAKACWNYYKGVHKTDSNDDAVKKLKEEIAGNLMAQTFPKSGEILTKSKLPAEKTFAAIRFPGGYGTTRSPVTGLNTGDHFFNGSTISNVESKYQCVAGDPRGKIEKIVLEENQLLGKFPLIAKVTAIWPDGNETAVPNVPVYFQLVEPDVLPSDSPFRAAEPPDKVMNYARKSSSFDDWQIEPPELTRPTEKKSGVPPQVNDKTEETEQIIAPPEPVNNDKTEETEPIMMPPPPPDSELQEQPESPELNVSVGETFKPSTEDWMTSKRYARKIVKEADAISADAVRKAEEEKEKAIKAQVELKREKLKRDADFNEESRKYKEYEQENLEKLNVRVKEANQELITAETAYEDLRMEKKKLETGSAPVKGLKLPEPKDEETRLRRAAAAEKLRLEREEKAKKNAERINQIEQEMSKREEGLKILTAKKKDAEDEYQKEAQTVKSKYPRKDALELAVENKTRIDDELSEAQKREKEASDAIKNITHKARVSLADETLKAGGDIHTAVIYILKQAAAKEDKTAPIYTYLFGEDESAAAPVPEILNAGQKPFIDKLLAEVESNLPADDPQRRNAPQAIYNGKAGVPVEGNIFEIKNRARFTDGYLNFGAIPLAAKGSEPHSVKADTNKQGYAGAIFMPSQCGGDKYKIRAFIDPEWLEKKPKGPSHKPTVDTGTMVTWRNIRLYRYLQKKNPLVDFGPDLKEVIQRGEFQPGHINFDAMYLKTDVTDLLMIPSTASEGQSYTAHDEKTFWKHTNEELRVRYRPLPVTPNSLQTQLNWGYCELIADCTKIEDMSFEEQKKGIQAGILGLKKFFADKKRVSWEHMFFEDATSPFMVNMRSCAHYNELARNAGLSELEYPRLDASDEDHFYKGIHWLYDAMLEYYAGGSVLPGLTIVQFPRPDSWDFRSMGKKVFADDGSGGSITPIVTSGYGPPCRGCYVSGTFGLYNNLHCYPATSNGIHEIGHVLGFAHQPPAPSCLKDAHQDAVEKSFQTPKNNECVCVMSYSGCYGDYCGKCIIALRGWAQNHVNNL